jgi:uncharacterized protein
VVFKVTEVCNLKCPYCYFFFGGDDSFEQDPPVVSMETVRKLATFLRDGAIDMGLARIDVVLHGGEPLMLGRRRFSELCETLKRGVEDVCEININMQTNGVLIDDDWVSLLERHSVRPGVSIDGPPDLHDRTRIDEKDRGTYHRTVRGIDKLGRDELGRAKVGGLCVVPYEESGRRIFAHLLDEVGLIRVDFLMPLQTWDDFDPARTQAVKTFYREVLQEWLGRGRSDIRVRSLSAPMRAMMHQEGAAVRVQHLKDLCNAVTVRSNGDLCPDDTLASISQRFRHTGYSIHRHSFAEFMAAPFWEPLRRSVVDRPAACEGCKWWGICRGGHADHRYSDQDQFRRRSTYCDVLKAIYEDVYEYMSKYLPSQEIDETLAAAESM